MNKVIDGYTYDTETATRLAVYGERLRLAKDYSEVLYQTTNGRFFLHCRRNGLSKYGWRFKSQRVSYEKLWALSRAEAFEWASVRLDGKEVRSLFPDMVEDA
jgi:hypothetical protein